MHLPTRGQFFRYSGFGKYEALNYCLVCADVAEKEQTEMNITFNSIISLQRNERVRYLISIDQLLFYHIDGFAQDCSNSHC